MPKNKGATEADLLQQLRDSAERVVAQQAQADLPKLAGAALIHELQVHQIELEMQNNALRQSQVALEASRDRYVDLYEFAPTAYLTLSGEGQIDSINLTGTALLGEPRAKLLGRRFDRFIRTESRDQWYRLYFAALRHELSLTCELSFVRQDGSLFSAELICANNSSEPPSQLLLISLTDTTARAQAEAARLSATVKLESLVAEQVAYLSELASDLTLSEQRERDRLHGLLHDDIQPLLIAARLSLSGLSDQTAKSQCLTICAEACEHISRSLDIARSLGLQLSPPLVRDRGLIPALESHCELVKRKYGLVVELNSTPNADPDDVAIRLVCFNAVRELLINVMKHAGAHEVCISLSLLEGDLLSIQVTDSGKGFDPEAIQPGTGLASIYRRMGMLGGTSRVVSVPGHGTTVTLLIPLRHQTQKGQMPHYIERRRSVTGLAQRVPGG